MHSLEDAVSALQPLGRHAGRAGREAHHVGHNPLQGAPWEEPEQPLGIRDKVCFHGRQTAHVVEARACGGGGQGRNCREEQESMAKMEMGRAAGIEIVSAEHLDAYIRANGVAHEDDKVIWLVVTRAVFVFCAASADPPGRDGDILIYDVHLGLDVERRIAGPKGLVLVVAEANEVATVYVVCRPALRGVEHAAQRIEEVDVVTDEAWVSADKVDEGALLRPAQTPGGLPYRGQHVQEGPGRGSGGNGRSAAGWVG